VYADDEIYANIWESNVLLLRPWLSPHRGISKDKLTQYLRVLQLRRELYPILEKEALKPAIGATP